MIASRSRRDIAVAIATMGILFSVYAVTFSGKLTSIDELAIYSEAESLVQLRQLARPQLLFAPYHNPVGRLEPLYSSILTVPYAFGRSVPTISSIHAVMLIAPLLTSVSGGLVYLTAKKLGYSTNVGIAASLVYGLSTMAWPYARSLYREPFLAVTWSLVTFALANLRNGLSWGWIAMIIASCILSVQIKVTAAVALPAFLVALFLSTRTRSRAWLLWIAGGLMLTSTLLALLVRYPGLDQVASTVSRLLPSRQMPSRMFGLVMSPGKGLVFFAPVALVGAAGLPLLWKRLSPVALVCAGVSASVLYAYSNYSSWYGGWCWGPRFLVPLMPMIALSTAPILAHRTLRWCALPVVMASTAVQFAASTMDWATGYRPLVQGSLAGEEHYILRTTRWWRSPAVAQVQAWRPIKGDVLWAQEVADGSFRLDPLLLGALSLCVVSAVVILVLVRRTERCTWSAISPAVVVLASLALLLRGVSNLPGFPGLDVEEAVEIAGLINDAQEPSVVATVSNEFGIHYFMGLLKGRFVHYWMSPAQPDNYDFLLKPYISSRELWLVVDYPHLPPEFSGRDLEWWLNEHLYRAKAHWAGDFLAVQYYYPPPYLERRSVHWRWDDSIALEEYAVSSGSPRAGDILWLEFRLRRVGRWIGYHHFFIHLISPDGEVIGTHDGPFRYGAVTADSWHKGEILVERRAIALPEDLDPGLYDLVIGIDTPEGLLEARGQLGTTTTVTVSLDTLIVQGTSASHNHAAD